MPLIVDPDSLSQGTVNVVADLAFTASAGANTTLTGAATLPAIATGEFFEIRNSSTVGNNGLYIATGTPTTSSIACTKVVGPNPVNLTAESTDVLGTTGAGTEKSVHFDTPTKTIYLLEQGNLSVDGVTMLAFHSFAKEEWKSDAFLIGAAPFPMVGISFAAGQWQFGTDPSGNNSGWKPAEDNGTHSIFTRRLFRNSGWDELDSNGNTIRKYFNVTTLGTFEDAANDLAYFRFGTDATDLGAAVNYQFAGPVNEPVEYFREFGNPGPTLAFATSSTITRTTGSFVTDGYQVGGRVSVRAAEDVGNNGAFVLTAVAALTLTVTGTPFTPNADDTTAQLAVDNSNVFSTYIRVRDADPNGKTFGQSNLAGAGETAISSKVIKFPLANQTDLDISETDANIAANSPYTQMRLRYFDQAFNREVDSATNRDFGIVLDVGTHSGVDGSAPGAASVLTSAEGGINEFGATAFNGGTLRIHEGTDENVSFPIVSHTDTTITVTGTIASGSNLSFTAQRATPVVASKTQIYEKAHHFLRQAADIDATDQVINGRTADDIAQFVGADLRMGSFLPANPNGGGTGVIIEGFDANDTNNLFFFDNTGVSRNFPFVAAGTFTFNQALVDDTDGEYWLFFERTRRTTNADIDTVAPSGDTYDLEGTLGTYIVGDYLQVSGFAQAANNGLFVVTVVNVSGSDYTVRKVDGTAVGTAETNQTVSVDEDPYPSPQAIVVNNNAGSPLAAAINGTSIAFDFDYDNNVQGGRTAATDAPVVLVAAGLEAAQVAVTKGLTITRATGLSFSVTSATERNYSNP